MKKNYIIFGVFAFAALAVIFFALYQIRIAEEETAKVAIPAPAAPKIEEEVPQPVFPPPRQLVPANPADYGMVVIVESKPVLTQSEWDGVISEKLTELKRQVPAEDRQKIYDLIKEDPAKTEEKLKQVEAKMRVYEEQLSREPDNVEIKGRLERLKMLKSIARGLIEIK